MSISIKTKLFFVSIVTFLCVFLIGNTFFSNQCFYDDAFETIVIAAKMPWSYGLKSFFSFLNQEADWIGAIPEDVAYFSRISETLLLKLAFPFFNFSSSYYFVLKTLFLAFACFVLLTYIYILTKNIRLAFIFSFLFSLFTPVYLSMRYFIDFSIPNLLFSAISLLLLPLVLEKRTRHYFVVYFVFLFTALLSIKMGKAALVVPLLTLFAIFYKLFFDKKFFRLLRIKLLAVFSILCIVSLIPLKLPKTYFPPVLMRNFFLFLIKNRPDYYIYDPHYESHLGLSLFDLSRWLLLIMVLIVIFWSVLFRKFFFIRLISGFKKIFTQGIKELYLFIAISWFIFEVLFLLVPQHSDPRYLVNLTYPFFILIALIINKFSIIIQNKKVLFISFQTFFFLGILLTLKANFSKNVDVFFSKDYLNRAFYKATQIIYASQHPLKSIEDYSLYAQSLRNHESFYQDVNWFPWKDTQVKEKYAVVEENKDAPVLKNYILIGKLLLENKRRIGFLATFWEEKEKHPPAFCFVYKRR